MQHTHRVTAPLMGCLSPIPLWQGVFLEWGRARRKWGGRNTEWSSAEGGGTNVRLNTCLASTKDTCSRVNSFSYCSFILSTSWSWAATSSFRAPFRAVSSLSRLLSTSSCSSLSIRTSCISTFSCIMSCGKGRQFGYFFLSLKNLQNQTD